MINWDYSPKARNRRRSTRPKFHRHKEKVREHDVCLWSEVRDINEAAANRLDQDSREFIAGAERLTQEGATYHSELSAEQRAHLSDNPPAPEPEIAIPVKLVVVQAGEGWTLSANPDSKLARQVLSKRQIQQRLSRLQRRIFTFARLTHPDLGNKTVDEAADILGMPRQKARNWHLILRNLMGEFEWSKSDPTKAREVKVANAEETLRAMAALPGKRAEPQRKKPARVGRKVIAPSADVPKDGWGRN